MKKFLVIQTAFIGDVVLATAIIEKINKYYGDSQIDFLLRKGNEDLFFQHPFINHIHIWDKKSRKYHDIFRLIREIRKIKYDVIINCQRFLSTGLITTFSGARQKIGFDKNPLSLFFTLKIKHEIGTRDNNLHEVERNLSLIENITNGEYTKPKLYLSNTDFERVKPIKPFICIAPASVWYTKQFPKEKWIEFIQKISNKYAIYLLGAKNDIILGEEIRLKSGTADIFNLAGELSYLETAALMKRAVMNYVNDSAPLHFASAVNAPVTAIFCSTVPWFGFGPLSDNSTILETDHKLSCRPCGLHGFDQCPQGHFKCADVDVGKLLKLIND